MRYAFGIRAVSRVCQSHERQRKRVGTDSESACEQTPAWDLTRSQTRLRSDGGGHCRRNPFVIPIHIKTSRRSCLGGHSLKKSTTAPDFFPHRRRSPRRGAAHHFASLDFSFLFRSRPLGIFYSLPGRNMISKLFDYSYE